MLLSHEGQGYLICVKQLTCTLPMGDYSTILAWVGIQIVFLHKWFSDVNRYSVLDSLYKHVKQHFEIESYNL